MRDGVSIIAVEQLQARLEICDQCKFKLQGKCTLVHCQCSVYALAGDPRANCPVLKWPVNRVDK